MINSAGNYCKHKKSHCLCLIIEVTHKEIEGQHCTSYEKVCLAKSCPYKDVDKDEK